MIPFTSVCGHTMAFLYLGLTIQAAWPIMPSLAEPGTDQDKTGH